MSRYASFGIVIGRPVAMAVIVAFLYGCTTIDAPSLATDLCVESNEARCSHFQSAAAGSSGSSDRDGDERSGISVRENERALGGLNPTKNASEYGGIRLSDHEGVGAPGAQGLVLPVNGWSVYREYTFVRDGDAIGPADFHKAREIADLIDQYPSYRIGIDGVRPARVNNVRRALIDAGVPADSIETGEFGDPQLRRDRWVSVLIRI